MPCSRQKSLTVIGGVLFFMGGIVLMLYVGGRLIADKVIIADSFTTRLKGLLGKKSMPPGSALIIKPCNCIHTWFMRFDIDVLFVSETGQVVKVLENMPLFRIAAEKTAAYVVELPAGTAKKHYIKPGNIVINPQGAKEGMWGIFKTEVSWHLRELNSFTQGSNSSREI